MVDVSKCYRIQGITIQLNLKYDKHIEEKIVSASHILGLYCRETPDFKGFFLQDIGSNLR